MIALFGGTFDPIHQGHIHLALECLKKYPFSKFYFVPAKQNPHKKDAPGADGMLRLAMVKAAIKEAGDPRFTTLDWEVTSGEPSYTVLTLQKLTRFIPTSVALIMGNEVFEGLPRWHEAGQVMRMADVVVVQRDPKAAYDPLAIVKQAGVDDGTRKDDRVIHSRGFRWIERLLLEPLPYSATSVRQEIQKKWESGDLETPPQGIQRSVWLIIKEKRLYSVTK